MSNWSDRNYKDLMLWMMLVELLLLAALVALEIRSQVGW